MYSIVILVQCFVVGTPYIALLHYNILCAILYDNNSSTFHAQHFAQSAEMGCELPLRVELFDDFPFCSENRSCFEACFAK